MTIIIKPDLTEIIYEDMKCIETTEDHILWCTLPVQRGYIATELVAL
jgi:hypothetical protein